MGLFDTIKNAILGHTSAPPPTQTATSPATPGATARLPDVDSRTGMAAPQASGAGQAVDVEAKLSGMAQKSGQKLNWQSSIVDLMKLVGLDPSLQNRKQLAQELGYTGDMNDSASMNIWLHRQVMTQLEKSGGVVPASLKGK